MFRGPIPRLRSASRQSLLTGKYPHHRSQSVVHPFADEGNVTLAGTSPRGIGLRLQGKLTLIIGYGDRYKGGLPRV